jgi:hypothetical protein
MLSIRPLLCLASASTYISLRFVNMRLSDCGKITFSSFCGHTEKVFSTQTIENKARSTLANITKQLFANKSKLCVWPCLPMHVCTSYANFARNICATYAPVSRRVRASQGRHFIFTLQMVVMDSLIPKPTCRMRPKLST